MKVPVDILPNPFEVPLWWGVDAPITREEVRKAVEGNRLRAEPATAGHPGTLPSEYVRNQHIERIAHLVVQGWDDAISVEPYPGNWPIDDGNHRLAAAFFRGDKNIEVSFGGFLSNIRDHYGNSIAEQVEKEWDSIADQVPSYALGRAGEPIGTLSQ